MTPNAYARPPPTMRSNTMTRLEPSISPDARARVRDGARRAARAARARAYAADMTPAAVAERAARRAAAERRARAYYPDLPIADALERVADDDAERV